MTWPRWPAPALTVAWMGLLLWAAGWRDPITEEFPGAVAQPWLWPTIAHLGLYGVLAALVLTTLLRSRRRSAPHPALLLAAFTASVAYGGLMELYQATVPKRVASWEDVGVNAVGAATALVAMRVLLLRARRSLDSGSPEAPSPTAP